MDQQATKVDDKANAMPPPPPPRPKLLDPEIESLKQCLQNALLKTGQLYAFYGDTRRLGISKFTNNPPQALTSALGRELERYDQLCDTVEGHLLRAIAVLQRDLRREEKKQEAIRLEAKAQKKLEESLQDAQPTQNFRFAEPAPPGSADFLPTNTRNSPTHPTGQVNLRRPSAISISSLQRPAIPLKLDLSSSSMRMTSEENSLMYSSGLASPVTLAPKSARPVGPNEFPDEFMAAFTNPVAVDVDVDQPVMNLTLAENRSHPQIKTNVGPVTSGGPSDKQMELGLGGMDMDMSMNDLFGDNSESSMGAAGVSGMFEMPGPSGSSSSRAAKETQFIDLTTDDIFSLSPNPITTGQNIRGTDSSAPAEAPSPATATLLAVDFSQNLNAANPLENSTGLSGSDQPFDMTSLGDLGGLPDFNPGSEFHIPDVDAFLSMGAGSNGGSNESPGKVAGSGEQATAL